MVCVTTNSPSLVSKVAFQSTLIFWPQPLNLSSYENTSLWPLVMKYTILVNLHFNKSYLKCCTHYTQYTLYVHAMTLRGL